MGSSFPTPTRAAPRHVPAPPAVDPVLAMLAEMGAAAAAQVAASASLRLAVALGALEQMAAELRALNPASAAVAYADVVLAGSRDSAPTLTPAELDKLHEHAEAAVKAAVKGDLSTCFAERHRVYLRCVLSVGLVPVHTGTLGRLSQERLLFWAEKYRDHASTIPGGAREWYAVDKLVRECRDALYPPAAPAPASMYDSRGNVR